jgi:pyruvate-ferredoxin/flavodoxin oxidoreductase
LEIKEVITKSDDEYFSEYVKKIAELDGNDIPVSVFTKNNIMDGTMKNDITYQEKRTIASEVPMWNSSACIQCGRCAFVCPHATIRAFILNDKEVENTPDILKRIVAC